MNNARLVSPVLVAGCIIIMVSFAIRASFGVFQIPIADEFGWARAEFSFAIAVQNLAWGIGQPLFGALAERLGIGSFARTTVPSGTRCNSGPCPGTARGKTAGR